MKTVTTTNEGADAPTFTFSGGAGNRRSTSGEIHIIARATDDNGQTRTIAGWVDRDELLDAITDADTVTRRVVEPAQ